MEDLVAIILLALVAGFLPLQFGAEISLLGTERGVRKASGLAIGVALFRILVGVLIVVISAGTTAALSGARESIRSFIGSTLSHMGQAVTSGQHAFIDALLIIAGVFLLLRAYRRLRGDSADQISEEDEKHVRKAGVAAMVLLGIAWAAAGPNQWLFTVAGMGQIVGLEAKLPGRVSAFALFLLLSSLMLMTPILFVMIRPETAGARLEKINKKITGVLRYAITIGFFLIGAFLIWKGGTGLVRYFNG